MLFWLFCCCIVSSTSKLCLVDCACTQTSGMFAAKVLFCVIVQLQFAKCIIFPRTWNGHCPLTVLLKAQNECPKYVYCCMGICIYWYLFWLFNYYLRLGIVNVHFVNFVVFLYLPLPVNFVVWLLSPKCRLWSDCFISLRFLPRGSVFLHTWSAVCAFF